MTGPSFSAPAAGSTPGTTPPASTQRPAPRPRPGAQPDEGGGLRVLTYLRLHWLMILFCGSLLGTTGAYTAWELLASKYESYALLQVSSTPTTLANQNNPQQARTDFVTYLKTTSALIKSEFVLTAALRDIKDLPTIKAQKDPIKYLDEELVVTWQDGSEVIRVTFKGPEPEDARKIVDAVQKAFMAEVIGKDLQKKREFLASVEDAQFKMHNILKHKTLKPDGKPAGGPVTPAGGAEPAPGTPALLPGDLVNRIDPRILVQRVVKLQEDVDKLPYTIRDLQRRESLLKEKLAKLQTAPIPPTTAELVERDEDVVRQGLRVAKAKYDYEFALNGGRPDAPEVMNLKAGYEAHQKKLAEVKKTKTDAIEVGRRTEEAKKYVAELEELARAIKRHEEQLDYAKKQLEKAEKQLTELPLPTDKSGLLPVKFEDRNPFQIEDSDRDVTDSVYRRLIQQYHLTKLEVESPPRVALLQPASHPTQKEMKKQIIGTVFAGLMGFVLVGLGVVAYETITRRVSSLADVKAALTMPVVGVLPYEPKTGAGTKAAGRGATNEAVDKLRAYVAQTWLSRGATCVAVTSPIADEGKAFAAFGLASSLAQAGYKTLLVDFDLREPSLHLLAGVANLAGACELLRGETDVRTAVQFLPSGLHLVPAGKWSDEARKAATGEKLAGVLAKLKEPYDCVVVHGHALLTVAESVEVARRCEVVLVCARYRETAVPLLKRAGERLATMEIPYCGVVYVGATEQESLC